MQFEKAKSTAKATACKRASKAATNGKKSSHTFESPPSFLNLTLPFIDFADLRHGFIEKTQSVKSAFGSGGSLHLASVRICPVHSHGPTPESMRLLGDVGWQTDSEKATDSMIINDSRIALGGMPWNHIPPGILLINLINVLSNFQKGTFD